MFRRDFIVMAGLLAGCNKKNMLPSLGFISGTKNNPSPPPITGNNGGGPNDAPFIIIMGQSNAQGVNPATELPIALQGLQNNHVVWNAGAWENVNAPLNTVDITLQPNLSGTGWGAIMESGYLLKQDYSKKIYFIQNHLGGQPISLWDRPNGSKWTQLVDYVTGAFANLRGGGLNPYPLAIIWVQGEADVEGPPSQYLPWYDKLTSLIAATRAIDPALSSIPWINYTLAKTATGYGDTACVLRTLLNSYMYKTVYDDPALNWIVNLDYNEFTMVDSVHWDTASALKGGSILRDTILTYPKFDQSSAEATAAINAIQASGYTMSKYEQGALKDYIFSLKSAGIWDKITHRWVFMGDRAASQKINIKNPGTHDLIPHGSFTYDALAGCTPDGSTAYFQTGINPSTDLTRDDVGIGVWACNVINHVNFDVGCFDGSTYFGMGYYLSGGLQGGVLNGGPAPDWLYANNFTCNYAKFDYDGVNEKAYNNGTLSVSAAKTSSPLPNKELFVSGFNNNGVTTFGSHQYFLITLTKNMTADDELLDYKLTEVYLQTFNRFRTP